MAGEGRGHPVLSLFNDTAKAPQGFRPMSIIAASFVAASGCYINARGSRPVWRHAECPEYLAFLKESGISTKVAFYNHVATRLHDALIPGSLDAQSVVMVGQGPNYDQVVEGCECVTRGIVPSGLAEDEASAADVIKSILARDGPPQCQLEHALAIIRTMAEHGVDLTVDDFRVSRARDLWGEALRVHRTEVEMSNAIRETVELAEQDHQTPARRRARAL